MIITAILALSLSSIEPSKAMPNERTSAPIQLAGLFGIGKQKGFSEIVQKVQAEQDYAPQVGRRPERDPEPLVPVRYLTPEQRAEPIIVDPVPIYVRADEQEDDKNDRKSPDQAQNTAPTEEYSPPSYITSTPVQTGQEPMPSGSATGSTATADYGTPG